MRRIGAIAVILLLGLWVEMAFAQNGSAMPVPYVYRLKIGGCTFDPTDRRQTGFQVQGTVGIVTALHGVADCKTVSAIADDGVIFTNLVIAAVDIDHDIALLTSSDLASLPTDGLAVSMVASTEILTAPLRIVGYPLGLDKQDVDLIESVRDIEPLDGVIPDDEESPAFLKRKSPDIDIDVLNLQAQLLPGHSGAPVLDDANGIVAVGDGGLRGGTVGRSWAIPWQAVKLESVDIVAVGKKLAELATKDITALSFSSTYPGQVANTRMLTTYTVQVMNANQNQPVANAEVLLTHSAGYEIGVTDSKGFYTFHLSTDGGVDYTQSQLQVEAVSYQPYRRNVPNILERVSPEILRLTALNPTATMPPTNTPPNTPTVISSSLCSFAFLVLDEQSEEPIRRATISVFVGVRQDRGTTDSTGYYLAHLPCSDEQDVAARVRVSANNYMVYTRSIFLNNETTEILLESKATPMPIQTATAVVTIAPTAMPQPTTTVTPTPITQPTCQVAGIFAAVWQAHKEKLGCNTSAVMTSPITYEPFENGYLVWSKLSDLIYVLPEGAYWLQQTNSWRSGEDSLPCSQAQQFGYPAMGFGKLWCTNEKVRTGLGNPLDKELPNEFAQQQYFEGGFVFEILGGRKIVLFKDGNWSVN